MSRKPPPLNRGMNLQQLIEGQKEQIAGLSPNAPVNLFYPTDINGAANLLTQQNKPDHYQVYPSLQSAVKRGSIVVQFYGQGKHLESSRLAGHEAQARKEYPDSFNPVVSFTMLSLNPMVYYNGMIAPSNIDQIFVMQDGRPEAMRIEEFIKYAIARQADTQRQKWA